MPAVALTDHGTLGGIVKFYRRRPDDRHQAHHRPRAVRRHRPQLARRGQGEQRPPHPAGSRPDRLQEPRQALPRAPTWRATTTSRAPTGSCSPSTSEGLIALTGCMSGRTALMLRDGDDEAAVAEVRRLAELLGPENVYVELQDAGLPEQRELLPKHCALAAEGRPAHGRRRTTCTTCATRTTTPTTRCCASRRRATSPTSTRMRYGSDEFYLKSGDEMYERFTDYPGACEATVEIAARCDVRPRLRHATCCRLTLYLRVRLRRTYLRELCEHGMRTPLRRRAGGRGASSASSSSSASSARWASTPTSSSSGTTSSSPRTTASPSAPAVGRPPGPS